MKSLTSSLSVIQLHKFMITCLGLVHILSELFSIFLREGRELAGILLGEGNVVSIKALGLMLRWVLGVVMYVFVFLVFTWYIGDLVVYSGGGGGCILREGGLVFYVLSQDCFLDYKFLFGVLLWLLVI